VVRIVVVAALLSAGWAEAQVCETPRVRDLAPLAAAVAQDKAMAQMFLKASQACQMSQSDACDAARLECSNQLASTLKAQVGFDEGAWLRDMLLPYGGLAYPASRTFQASAQAMDTACNGDASQLMNASSRRSLQAARRQAIADEYPRYVQWVTDQAKACRDRSSVEEARRAQERSEAEKLAAVALAAQAAEELRQKTEAEAKKKAEEAARAQAEAQKSAEQKAKEAQQRAEREKMTAAEKDQADKEEAEKRAKEEREAAEKKAREERESAEEKAERRAKEQQEAAEKAQRDAKAQAEREKAEAERKMRDAAEVAAVKTREDHKLALRTQKEKLTQQAVEAERRAAEIAGMTFTAEQSQTAAQLQTERVQALERARTLRTQIADIVIDDADERSRGSLGIMGGGGATNWPGSTAGALGGQLLFHVGFWGTAPSEGMASGFELRAIGRFLSTLGMGPVQQAEGVVTARYFFGRLGIGGAIEFRWNQPLAAPSAVNIGFGPAIGLAFVDTPKTRVTLNAKWLPLTQQGFQNPLRTTGDLEISYDFLVFSVSGGVQSQPVPISAEAPMGGTILGWYFGAYAGARLRW
jgi:hypothetical protein